MSEELEWELLDLFESRMFAFPVYEHTAARRIVRYLLLRGVPAEEIADAIADSPAELRAWLDRAGRYMVGEWVIAWVNESRAEYKRGRATAAGAWRRTAREAVVDTVAWSEEEDDDDDSDGGAGAMTTEEDVFYGDMVNPVVGSVRSLDTGRGALKAGVGAREAVAPPPLPPRRPSAPTAPAAGAAAIADDRSVPDLDAVMTDVTVSATFSEDDFYDSGAPPSDLYSCIDADAGRPDVTADKRATDCTCTLAHYSYIERSPRSADPSHHADHDYGCALHRPPGGATDAAGYVCVWTPTASWAAGGPYRVSTARRPVPADDARCDAQLVWQVRVQRHLVAGREVHRGLRRFRADADDADDAADADDADWYHCPLATVVETLSKVAIRYRW